MTGKLGLGTTRPWSAPVREAGGASCLSPSTSELLSRAQRATLMAGTGDHPGNLGQKGFAALALYLAIVFGGAAIIAALGGALCWAVVWVLRSPQEPSDEMGGEHDQRRE